MHHIISVRIRRAFALAVGTVLLVASAWQPAAAQGGAAVGGVVADDTGGALPGVSVTITNTNTGATQTLVSGPEGNYRAVNLQPGPYTVTAGSPASRRANTP